MIGNLNICKCIKNNYSYKYKILERCTLLKEKLDYDLYDA